MSILRCTTVRGKMRDCWEDLMHRLKKELRAPGVALGLLLTLLAMSACSGPAREQAGEDPGTITVYERARLIVGNGKVIESTRVHGS